MGLSDFACERSDIDLITDPDKRNLLTRMYCDHHFHYLNLVDFNYRILQNNSLVIFMFIAVTFPIVYKCVIHLAENHLALNMRELSKRLKLSQSLAAVTLIAFGNIAPELFSSFSHADTAEGTYIVVGVGFGVYIFSMTVSFAVIVFSSKHDIIIPKTLLIKEFAFSGILIIVIFAFGVTGTTDYNLLICLILIYTCYITTSFMLNPNVDPHELLHHSKHDKSHHAHHTRPPNGIHGHSKPAAKDHPSSHTHKTEHNPNEIHKADHSHLKPDPKHLHLPGNPAQTNHPEKPESPNQLPLKSVKNDSIENEASSESNSDDPQKFYYILQEEKSLIVQQRLMTAFIKNTDFGLVSFKKQENDLVYECEFEANDPSTVRTMTKLTGVTLNKWALYSEHIQEIFTEGNTRFENIMLGPLNLLTMLTLPYSKNPLMIGRLKYIPLGLSMLVFNASILHLHHRWVQLSLTAVISGCFFFSLSLLKVPQSFLRKLYSLAAFLGTLAWIRLFVSLLLDYVIFFSFYLSVNEIIVFSIIVSAGNCIGEVLTTSALARAGFGIMAILSTFSGQFLNLILSLALNIIFSLRLKSVEFDLFGIDHLRRHKKISEEKHFGNLFMGTLMATSALVLLLHFCVAWINKFRLSRRFSTLLLWIYGMFLGCSVFFGMKIRELSFAHAVNE